MAGGEPFLFLLAFILPHGIFKIPAIFLFGASILRLGATVVSPPPGKTVGQAWIGTLADGAKIALGLGVPLLVMGAIAEVYITPLVVLRVFGGG